MARGLMNFNLARFDSQNKFSFPDIPAYTSKIDVDSIRWLDYESARKRSSSGLHFYCDDYRYNGIWQDPVKYVDFISRFENIIQFDFSLYYDYPVALQIFNKYRNHWLSAFYSSLLDIQFIPNISVSTSDCWEWSFDGFPSNSVVAFSDIGAIRDNSSRNITYQAYEETIRRLSPLQVIYFTRSKKNAPSEADVVQVPFLKER